MDKSNKIVKKANKVNKLFWKDSLRQGKNIFSHPLIFYPLLIAFVMFDFFPIKDAIEKVGEQSWNRETLIVFALFIAFVINAGITIVRWISSIEGNGVGKKVLMTSLIIVILVFYSISCVVKWESRNIVSEETTQPNDPAAQKLDEMNGTVSDSEQEENSIGTDIVAILSCIEALGTSMIIYAISFEPDPYKKERYQKQKRRQQLMKVYEKTEGMLNEEDNYIEEINKQQQIIETKIEYERTEGAQFLEKYLEIHARYMLAEHLATPEALTYLIQENEYVEALFPAA